MEGVFGCNKTLCLQLGSVGVLMTDRDECGMTLSLVGKTCVTCCNVCMLDELVRANFTAYILH